MEAIVLLEARVNEIDMVMNIGWLKSRRLDEVGEEIGALHAILSVGGVTFKVILETGYLTDEEKVLAAELAARYGADFVKTSTGFGPSGATASDVRLLRQSVPQSVGVKAAGGIRTLAQVEEMLTAGATRIGTSATRAIASELGVEA
jgi:deoxyribose-phosphate aldolase